MKTGNQPASMISDNILALAIGCVNKGDQASLMQIHACHFEYLWPSKGRCGPECDVDGEVPDDPVVEGALAPPRALAQPVTQPGSHGPVGAGDETGMGFNRVSDLNMT